MLLFKKYELLSDCLEKQGRWLESLRAMASCCQMFVLSSGNFTEMGALDSKALEYVEKWLNRKRRMVQQMGRTKETLQIKRWYVNTVMGLLLSYDRLVTSSSLYYRTDLRYISGHFGVALEI